MKSILLTAAIVPVMLTATLSPTSAQKSLTMHFPASTGAIVAGANVSVLDDQTILIRYAEKGIAYKAFYGKDGAWLHTVASYDESSLPAPVKRQVYNEWHGWNISYVDEVRTPGIDPVYRVQLRRGNHLTIIRVSGDDIETESELTLQ